MRLTKLLFAGLVATFASMQFAAAEPSVAGLWQKIDEATGKNKPLQDFFRAAGIAPDAEGAYRISRSGFSPPGIELPHHVVNLTK